MVEVPRHPSQHERAASARLVTDSATVTVHEAMDRSRNRAVLAGVREQVASVTEADLLGEVKDGADYDWGGLFDLLKDEGAPQPVIAAVETLSERFERPYPSLLRLGVNPDEDVDFVPGQYVTLRAHGTPRAYSIASPPSADDLEFAIRRVPGGRLTSELFVNVDVGDEVVVRGPNGEMVLEHPRGNDVVFLATGTGVAPFASMIQALFDRGWDEHDGTESDVWLFVGCGWKDDLPYSGTFQSLDEDRERFHFVPTLTREALLTEWTGETDYVQQVLVKYLTEESVEGVTLPRRLAPYRSGTPRQDVDARIDPAGTDLYACGVTAMVSTLVRAARAIGVPEENMQYEGFG